MKSKKYIVYGQCTPSVQSVFWSEHIQNKVHSRYIFLPIHKDLTCLPMMLVVVLLCSKRFSLLYRCAGKGSCCWKRLHNWCQPLCGAIPRAWFHTRPNSKPEVFIFANLYNLGPIESAPWLSWCIWASQQRLVAGDTILHLWLVCFSLPSFHPDPSSSTIRKFEKRNGQIILISYQFFDNCWIIATCPVI